MSILKITIIGICTMLALMLALMPSEGRSPKKTEETNTLKVLTVEQAGNKNIKELKGMPNAQLIPSMRFRPPC